MSLEKFLIQYSEFCLLVSVITHHPALSPAVPPTCLEERRQLELMADGQLERIWS